MSLIACGPEEANQLAVLQRHFEWQRLPSPLSTTTAQSRHWDAEQIAGEWQVAGAQGTATEGRWQLSGYGRFEMRAPPGALDTRRQRILAVVMAASGVEKMKLQWHGPGGSFSEERSLERPVLEGDLATTTSVLLTPLLRDQAPGPVAALRLVFVGRPGQALAVSLEGIGLQSEFDGALASGHFALPISREGVRAQGQCLALPGALSTSLRGGPRQRLQMQLATSAREAPLTLRISAGAARLPVRELTVPSDGAWHTVSVDLSALPSDENSVLTLAVEDGPGFLLIGAVTRSGPDGAPRPDVVLWLVDTLRSDRLGSYGYSQPTDPALSRLAAEGVRFERVYAVSNWTRPSVSTIHTGVGPEVHGNVALGLAIPPDLPTLAEELGRHGYLTISLNTNHHAGAESGLDRGFDLQYEPQHFPRLDPPSTLTSQQIMDVAEELLLAHVGERLFLSIHCLDPHGPYLPEPGDLELLARAGGGASAPASAPIDERIRFSQRSPGYDAEIAFADRQLGRLDDLLRETGRHHDTLLAFVSDHGEGFFEHGTWGHWRSLYEEEVRVPWVLRWPGGLPSGVVLEQPVGLADVAPTLLGLLGLAVPAPWSGRDLSALCRGSQSPREIPQIIDSLAGGQQERGRRRLSVVRGALKLHAELDDQGRLVPVALYDLGRDPGERLDLLTEGREPAELLALIAAYLHRDAGRVGVFRSEEIVDPEQLRWLQAMGYLGR